MFVFIIASLLFLHLLCIVTVTRAALFLYRTPSPIMLFPMTSELSAENGALVYNEVELPSLVS